MSAKRYELWEGDSLPIEWGKGHGPFFVILASAYEALEAELAALEGMYQQVIREVLLCDPQPASSRADDKLEPPWEVIARVRTERDALQAKLSACEAELAAVRADRREVIDAAVETQAENERLRTALADIADAPREPGNKLAYTLRSIACAALAQEKP